MYSVFIKVHTLRNQRYYYSAQLTYIMYLTITDDANGYYIEILMPLCDLVGHSVVGAVII